MTSASPQTEAGISRGMTRGLALGVVAVSALVGVSALWGIWTAVGQETKVWALFGFEIVTLAAALLGLLVGLGRLRDAPALAVFSIAGTVFASATLGRFSAIVTWGGGDISQSQAVRQLATDPVFDGRLLAAFVLGVLGLCVAFGRQGASWRSFVIGLLAAAPVAGIGLWILGPGRAWLLAPIEDGGDIARVVVSLLGGLVLAVLGSMAVHQVVRAFELQLAPLGRASGRSEGSGKVSGAAPNKGA